MDLIRGNATTSFQFYPGNQYESNIDFENDQDWFYIHFLPGINYELTLRSITPNALPDPNLRLIDGDGNVLYTGNTNQSGNFSRIRFEATHGERMYLAVKDDGTGVGQYRLAARALDDDYANNIRGSGTLDFVNGFASAKGMLEQTPDQDWFEVQLKPQTWYEFKTFGTSRPAFFIRKRSRQKVSALDTHDRFYSEDGGKHYVVVRRHRWGGLLGEYQVTVREGELPHLSAISTQASSGVHLSRWLDTNEFPIKYFHIYSDDKLGFGVTFYQFQEKEPGRIYRANTSNFWRWQTISGSKKTSNLYVRGLTSLQDDGFTTPWIKINVTAPDATELVTGSLWRPQFGGPREINFAFADALPKYFEGDDRFPDFMPLTEGQRDSVREAIRRWDVVESSLEFVEVAPNSDNDNAQFMIFSADIDQPVTGFRPSPSGGSDLVLDRDSSVLSDLTLGSQGFFELLRGLGKTLGLKANNDFSRNETVMGRYVDNTTFNSIFPTTPGPLDIHALTQDLGRFRYKPNNDARTDDSTYQFQDNVGDTKIDGGGEDTIDGSGDRRVLIDLTPGANSFQWTGNQITSQITIAYGAEIENAQGGSRNDRLLGNGWDNILMGGLGQDFVQGRAGNDELMGGKANDEYYYELGDGNDVIMDEGGAHDRLVIHGIFTFNDIVDDLTFQKVNQGKDLVINLALDGDDRNVHGSITIQNMHRRRYQIETLSISNPQRDFGNVSLRNLFNQATPELQRFSFTQGNDEFGRFVAPA